MRSIYEEDFLEVFIRIFVQSEIVIRHINRVDNPDNDQNPSIILWRADIKCFFDKVSHEELLRFLEIRIVDRTLLELIRRFLKAGYGR